MFFNKSKFYIALKKIRTRYRTAIIRIPGLIRPLDALCRLTQPNKVVEIECAGFKIYADPGDEVIGTNLLLHQQHEAEVGAIFTKVLRPGMRVLDLGANIGYFSLFASRLVEDHGRVFSFEPDPYNYELLIKNIRLNNSKNIFSKPWALSNQNGTSLFFKDRINFGLHSLIDKNISNPERKNVAVTSVTLDSWMAQENISHIDFIKIDIQGAEGLVFEKAGRLLDQHHLHLVLEFWPEGLRQAGSDPENVLAMLKQKGFHIEILRPHKAPESQQNIKSLLDLAEENSYLNLYAWK